MHLSMKRGVPLFGLEWHGVPCLCWGGRLFWLLCLSLIHIYVRDDYQQDENAMREEVFAAQPQRDEGLDENINAEHKNSESLPA